MCLSPIEIPNPYISQKMVYSSMGRILFKGEYDSLRPCSPTITVACRHCEECLASARNELVVRAHFESMTSYVYNIMLSYDERHIPTITLLSESGDSVRIVYPRYSDIQSMFKRLRNDPDFKNRDFRYLVASEYGTANRRPHWHILFFLARRFTDTVKTPYLFEKTLKERLIRFYSVNVGTRKNPIYDPLLTKAEKVVDGKTYTNYYVHYIDTRESQLNVSTTAPITAVTSYLTKYALKEDVEFSKYKSELLSKLDPDNPLRDELIKLIKPVVKYSKNFGIGFSDTGYKLSFPPLYQTKAYTHHTYISSSLYKEALDFYKSVLTSIKHKDILEDFYDKVERKFINTTEQISYYYMPFYAELFINILSISREFRLHVANLNDSFVFPPKKKIMPMIGKTQENLAVEQYKSVMGSPVYKLCRDAIEKSINNTNTLFLQITFTTSEKTFTFALPRYYKERFYTVEDRHRFLKKRGLENIDQLTPAQRDLITTQQRQAEILRDVGRKVNDIHRKNLCNPFKRDRNNLPYATSFSEYDAIFIPPDVESILQERIDNRFFNRIF